MKKRVTFLFVCFFSLVIAACTNTERPNIEEEVLQIGQEGLNPETVPTGTGVTANLSKPVTDNIVSLQQGKTLEHLKVSGEDGEYYCNLEENLTRVFLRAPEEYPVLVCKDPVYDITYYVNYGRDYFIYAKRGDVSEKVVEIPARDLYCRQGILYFRTESYGSYEFDSFMDGAILAYNPADGSVEVVIDAPTFEMAVYPDGIFYVVNKPIIAEDGSVVETSVRRFKYFYSFENREIRELGPTLHTTARWKEYQLVMEFVEEDDRTKTVYHMETSEGVSAGILPNLTEILESHRIKKDGLCYLEVYRIKEDSIYYTDKETDRFMRYSMETGEETTVVELGVPSIYSRAFIIHNETAYFSNGIRYSFAENKQYKVKIQDKERALIQDFYTDGDALYILADGMLWLYEERKVADYGMENSLIPGRAFITGCYEAVLHPLGE